MRALNAHGLTRKVPARKSGAWDAAAVADRVKQYRDVVKRRFGQTKDQIDQGRNIVVWKWLELFNEPKAIEKGAQNRGLPEG